MPKNLILIPLESISNTILWQYRVELATVWRLRQQSFVYDRFQSSSTSTATILTEFYYGCSDVYDGLSYYRERTDPNHPWIRNYPRRSGIWQLFYLNGYDVFEVFEHYLDPPVRTKDWMMDCSADRLLAAAEERLAAAKADGRPIILMFRMVISHMAFDDGVKMRARTFSERFRLGYARLDGAVNRLLTILAKLGLWDDSVIVCFGDHGDELWSHGLNKGYCHAVSPYASLTCTPLFIYDNVRPPGSSDRLVSTIDLRESLLRLLLPDCDLSRCGADGGDKPSLPLRRTPFDGLDAFNEEREFAFAQNLFALQLEYADLERGLTKGYSVTDGVYRLVVSSGGSDPRNGGLEFFCDQADPANARNLLDFFALDANGDVGKFSPPAEATDRGFALTFNERAVKHLAETYHKLKKALRGHVREKERRALRSDSGPSHVMPESVFRHARKRLFKD